MILLKSGTDKDKRCVRICAVQKKGKSSREEVLERNSVLELLEGLRIHISFVESILTQLKENDKIAERLKTIFDIGKCFVMLIRHEIDRIERFPTSDKLFSYTGLVPSTYSSGGKTHFGVAIGLTLSDFIEVMMQLETFK